MFSVYQCLEGCQAEVREDSFFSFFLACLLDRGKLCDIIKIATRRGKRESQKMPTSDNEKAKGNTAKKRIIIAILIVIAIGAGGWYYFSQVRPTNIEKIFSNPTAYAGKEIAIEGEVTDRTAFFGDLKFYKLKDKSGEITVITKKSLPEVRSSVSVKGRIDDAFPLGDQKLVVFMEESVAKKDSTK